ncbi:hypothetical protein BU25DRAFT_473967 [Macroventuria anomochaeta]|uniref:Uncharacterized protein n=1 Tax=Macroventuria anomochaeta TaxID=301207 RepID=A0ACB6RTR4_9PLEO|nr:uncharacterized protein BU25DRAFT_473967 [Macroventuria anomochaeta]KAF2625380.1 hypothetical protein BU25DRAFT_473967 [Macroventuria anomochaeta]
MNAIVKRTCWWFDLTKVGELPNNLHSKPSQNDEPPQHSEYFRKALSGPWKEADEGCVRLEDVESGPFNIFVDWLYSEKIAQQDDNPPDEKGARDMELEAIALGDRFLAPAFVRALHRHFVDRQFARSVTESNKDLAPPFSVIICAFSKLAKEDPNLDMLVDLMPIITLFQNFIRNLATRSESSFHMRSSFVSDIDMDSALRSDRQCDSHPFTRSDSKRATIMNILMQPSAGTAHGTKSEHPSTARRWV